MQSQFPGTLFQMNTGVGQRGIDAIGLAGRNANVRAELKPFSFSGQRSMRTFQNKLSYHTTIPLKD